MRILRTLVGGAIAFGAASGGLASAAMPAAAAPANRGARPAARVIHACLDRRDGELRIVRAGKRCRRGETALSWHQRGATGRSGAGGRTGHTGPQGRTGATGPGGATGTAGATGANGLAGTPGPAASRLSYDAAADANSPTTTIVSVGGLALAASCQLGVNGDVGLALSAMSSSDATLYFSSSVDVGTDPTQPGQGMNIQGQLPLSAGQTQSIGGPGTSAGMFARAFSSALYVTADGIVDLRLMVIANAVTAPGSCAVKGSAIPTG